MAHPISRLCVGTSLALSLAYPALAQDRTSDNAVTQAEDAFGFSVGRETIGIYNAGQTRGFSPTAAGNVRIDGLYFDPVFGLPGALIQSTSIKVGLSAQGYPFTAPSGVFDQTLRRPGDKAGASLIANADSWGGRGLELDGTIPVNDRLGVFVSAGLGRTVYPNGTDNFYHNEAVVIRWRPTDSIEILPFWGMFNDYNDEAGTFYIPAGDYIPVVGRAHHDESPSWSDNRFTGSDAGVVANAKLGANTVLRLGAFKSIFDFKRAYIFLMLNELPNATGERLLIVDPPLKSRSYSGELRLSHSIVDGPRLHVVHASVRGRDSDRPFGGSAFVDYGVGPIGEHVTEPEPEFVFSEPSRNQTRQFTYGIAYDGRWKNVGELSFGVSRANFRKETDIPGLASVTARSHPWLYNGTLAVVVSKSINVYAGYSKGFEESGLAPASAANRNEPLSSIITEQKDAGARIDLGGGVSAVAGLFDLSRPYFGFDSANVFHQIGSVRSRGVEFSVSGPVVKNVNLLVGGVFFNPKVTKSADAVGDIGSKPAGLPSHILNLNGNWSPPSLKGVQFDVGISHRGRLPSTTNNEVYLPARFAMNIGTRYGFDIGSHKASVRLQASNIFDNRDPTYTAPSVYGPRQSRQISGLFTIDY